MFDVFLASQVLTSLMYLICSKVAVDVSVIPVHSVLHMKVFLFINSEM